MNSFASILVLAVVFGLAAVPPFAVPDLKETKAWVECVIEEMRLCDLRCMPDECPQQAPSIL